MRRGVIILGLIAMLSLFLAGCDSGESEGGGNNNGNQNTADTQVPTATNTPDVTATPNPGELTATAIVALATNAPQVLPSATAAGIVGTPNTGQLTATALVAQATANASGGTGSTTSLFTPPPAATCIPGLLSRSLTTLSEQIRTALEQTSLKVGFVDVFVTDSTQDCVTTTHQSTTYRMSLTLADIPSEAAAIQAIEQVLGVLASFPTPPGTAPASLEIGLQVFRSGINQWERWIKHDYTNTFNAWSAGQRGADLLRVLGGLQEQ